MTTPNLILPPPLQDTGPLETMGEARGERAVIVAWLRAQASCGCAGKFGYCSADSQPLAFADAIERGEHIAPLNTKEGE